MLPVFLVIVSAAIDLGRIAYARVTIANVAREASFQAAQTPTSYLAGQPCDEATNLVVCRAILESKGSVITVLPSDISMTCSPSCTAAMGNTVRVTATGRFNLLTPLMSAFFGGTAVSFSSTAVNQIGSLPPSPTDVPTAPPTAGPTAAPTADPSAEPTAEPTASPTPAPTANCSGVSAAFTKTSSPASNKSPVTVTVTDTTTYNPLCVTVWAWVWGDGHTTYGRTQLPHVYSNTTGKTGNTKTFNLTLTVTSGAFTSTSGAVVISVIR